MRCLLPSAILALVMTGCAGDTQRIVGVWVNQSEAASSFHRQLTFTSDGQYSFLTIPKKSVVTGIATTVPESSAGTYKVEGGVLTLTSSTPGTAVVQNKVASLTDTTLVLETMTGPLVIHSYTRVAPSR